MAEVYRYTYQNVNGFPATEYYALPYEVSRSLRERKLKIEYFNAIVVGIGSATAADGLFYLTENPDSGIPIERRTLAVLKASLPVNATNTISQSVQLKDIEVTGPPGFRYSNNAGLVSTGLGYFAFAISVTPIEENIYTPWRYRHCEEVIPNVCW